MRISTILFCTLLLCLSTTLYAQVDVLTQHNDVQRTGWNSQETMLNTSNVRVGTFGKLYSYAVDDQVYAQPLIVTGVTIPGVGTRNVAYIATLNNTVYAFDADSARAAGPYWQTNLTPTGTRPPINSDMNAASLCGGHYLDFSGHIGIVGTPVIDKTAGTIYLVSRSVSTDASQTFVQYLHAINISNGQDRPGSPMVITAQLSGTGDGAVNGTVYFNPQTQNQRPGLLLLNGVVYIGYSGHCDWNPYHGWLLGYDAATLQQKYVYCTTSDGEGGGTWMGGNGPAADAAGNIYLATGNGTTGTVTDPTSPRNRASSLLKLTPSGSTLAQTGYFQPANYVTLNGGDLDFGPCETLLLPGMNRVLTGAKDGSLYLADINNLGGYNSSGGNFIDSISLGTNAHLRSSFGYYKGTANEFVYTWSENTALKAWPVNRSAGNFTVANVMTSGIQGPIGNNGANMSTSSNGSVDNTAILWVTHAYNCDANHQTCPGVVRAINANDVTKELWNSTLVPGDNIGNYGKFCSPTVANGKVYIASLSNMVAVYGLENNGNDTCTSGNIALNQPATASSLENQSGYLIAQNAFDGDMSTRWSSQYTDAQWIYVDLGKSYDLCKVAIYWENAYGANFDIQVSDDAQTWTTVYSTRNNTSKINIMPLQGRGRYVKMNGITRATGYGYSIYEMQVYGTPTITCFPPTGLAASNIQPHTATISWNAVAGVTGYTVQYKASSDVAATVTTTTGTSLSLSALTCSADYLFDVAANCSNGQTSTYASQGFTTLACPAGCGPVPTRWTTSDIGNPGVAGQACYDQQTFTLHGSGADIGGTTDQFNFAYVSLTSDDQFFGHILSQDAADPADKAGIMIRQDLTANAPNAFIALTNAQGALFQSRSTIGGGTTAVSTPGLVAPYWVKLVKAGSVYSGYVSPDGLAWTQVGSSVDLGFGAGGSSTYAGLAITSHNNTLLSTATLDNVNHGSPLPIELTSFTGRSTGQAVILEWTTAFEQNVGYFEVERSADGVHYAPVANVKAVGNSSTTRNYSATDGQPLRGVNYYRLREVDLDNKQVYSPVILIRCSNLPAPTLFPNPASSYFRLVAGTDPIKEVNVYDLTGRKTLGMLNSAASANLFIPCSRLAPGTYFVEIRTEKGRYVQKMIKN